MWWWWRRWSSRVSGAAETLNKQLLVRIKVRLIDFDMKQIYVNVSFVYADFPRNVALMHDLMLRANRRLRSRKIAFEMSASNNSELTIHFSPCDGEYYKICELVKVLGDALVERFGERGLSNVTSESLRANPHVLMVFTNSRTSEIETYFRASALLNL
jgi:hypothetical protein